MAKLWKTLGILKKKKKKNLYPQSEMVLTHFYLIYLYFYLIDLSCVQTKLEMFSGESDDSTQISLKNRLGNEMSQIIFKRRIFCWQRLKTHIKLTITFGSLTFHFWSLQKSP